MTDLWHDAFYKFVTVTDPDALSEALTELCRGAGVLGSILVAAEGINGMLAGTDAQLEQVRDGLREDERFSDLFFKRTACKQVPFKRLKIKVKAELVPLGVAGIDGAETVGAVSPAEWRELLERDDVVLIDNRNAFEYELGHFKGAVNPQVASFRDFAEYAEAHLDEWQGKKVAMYCTGGIRCEKTVAWLKGSGLELYQLHGGILHYLEQHPGDEAFEGECFVFDDRVALDTHLQETETSLEDLSPPLTRGG